MPEQTSQKPENTTLTIQNGLEVELLNYGAALKSIRVPVGDKFVDVLLSYPADEEYLRDKAYPGATVGRYAGRIDSGVAQLRGRSIQLVCNEQNTGHCLHGGSAGLCLEFQGVPNAPNMDGFRSTLLKPGQIYRRQITLEFDCLPGTK
ncbi:MAG: hypothetical protein WBM36_10240 [Lysobacterales bacterium]